MHLVFCCLAFISFYLLRRATAGTTCTTFPAAPVESTRTIHSEIQSLSNKDLQRWANANETLTLENTQLVHRLVAGFDYRVKNAFIGTVFAAYSHHYPLELSVEDIWVLIVQGISMYLNKNAEKFRHLFVSHEGKKKLNVTVDDLQMPPESRVGNISFSIPAINWPEAVRRMCSMIKADLKTDLASVITEPFSETTPVQQAVFDACLMDTVKAYFEYRFVVGCGIPQIILCGSAEDYQSIIDRLSQLKTLFIDLHWWLDPLISHVTKFKASVEGNPDTDWWRKMVGRYNEMSGINMLTGWLVDFILYADSGSGEHYIVERNHRIVKRNHHTSDTLADTVEEEHGISFSDFFEAVTQTDFTLDNKGDEIQMKLVAGFLGIGQNPETSALRPVLGWLTALTSAKSSPPNTEEKLRREDL